MDRRRYLTALTGGTVAVLAGCSGLAGRSDSSGTDGATDTSATTDTPAAADRSGNTTATGGTAAGVPQQAGDIELPVPRSELDRGAAEDAIPAITDPAFGTDWSDFSVELDSNERVIGVERGGEARAYPLAILNWHEIVNDTLDGPLLVTYCPLCGSGLTAERRVDDEETVFGVSGFLWNSDLVMYDRATDSLWSQIMATAIRGPKTGETLSLVPSTLTTWDAWSETHPETQVLLPPPASGAVGGARPRDYGRNPYAGYGESRRIGIGSEEYEGQLHPKADVIGIAHDEMARAYPFDTVTNEGVINDRVGDLPVVVTVDSGDALVAYERRIDGDVLSFEPAGEDAIRADGSRWRRATGEAVDGPHKGTQLPRANDASPMFFFAWRDFNPETEVYGS
ncbi:DUF3179 domain-containing protein [Halococcus saccharolyticus]|uniref:DUF3179 domain-containing protein n=1 Tax=Halococcus saccharolyticus DSM 5350 TaxID=1227455 RepID=M0MCM7_9EURY|nr:DUF3179 domain-containing protein [Halococcus saccharolyticus]EMA43093.1 hypothetical protein C449_13982 [Halococcus saccharolyticus DSM 5350]